LVGGASFRPECLHGAHRTEVLRRIGRCAGELILSLARSVSDRPPCGDERENDEWNRNEYEARQLRAGEHHHHQGSGQYEKIAERDRHRCAERRLDLRRVGGKAGEDFTSLGRVEERGIERSQVAKHGVAQVGDNPLAERRDEIESRAAG
jgi:hypothetical protein